MPEVQSIVVLATEATMARLRSARTCRALVDPARVRHVRLDPFVAGHGEAVALEPDTGHLLAAGQVRDGDPVVVLWESAGPDGLAEMVRTLRSLGNSIRSSLQKDRTPLPVAACIMVAANGLGPLDRDLIERLFVRPAEGTDAPADDSAVRTVLPVRSTLYLMGERTRVDGDGRTWSTGRIWPIAVTRLIASIAVRPHRTPGLRAWRSFEFDPSGDGTGSLERSTLSILQQVFADSVVDEEDRDRRPGTAGEDLQPREAPNDAVSTDRSPRHHVDDSRVNGAHPPPVPAFWSLEPHAMDFAEEVEGGATIHVDARLAQEPGSGWHDRKRRRGELFRHHRFERVREGVETLMGPRSIVGWAWQRIHRVRRTLPWIAEGGFFRIPDRQVPEEKLLERQADSWLELVRLDREARIERDASAAQALELDLARGHFVGIGWRVAAAGAAALFAAGAVGIGSGTTGSALAISIGIGAAASAGGASLLLLLLELRAGARGRDVLEEQSRLAENAVAKAFLARLRLGADGERRQRTRAWLQSAARVREVASRLLLLEHATLRAGSRRERQGLPGEDPSNSGYREATSIDASDPTGSIADLAATLRKDGQPLVSACRRDFDAWWSAALGDIDPHLTGGIAVHRFRPMLFAKIAELRDRIRAELLTRFEESFAADWCRRTADRLDARVGAGTDLAGLSLPTHRARGFEERRVVLVASSSPTVAGHAGERLVCTGLGSFDPIITTDADEAWVGLGIIIEEIDVSFRPGSERPEQLAILDEGTPPRPRERSPAP